MAEPGTASRGGSNVSEPYKLEISTIDAANYPDEDQLLLHAAFQVLVNYNKADDLKAYVGFLETEMTKEDSTFVGKRLPYYKEALELYNWWTQVRPKRVNLWEEVSAGRLTGQEAATIEDCEYGEDTEMLVRLVKIREILWS